MSDGRTGGSAIESIAIVGMSGRFPGANNLDEFWDNLRTGTESIEFPSDDDLRSLGVDDSILERPNYVKARSTIEGMENFDAPFFGINPGEARILDPQHRLFLEVAWEAFEDAGCDPGTFPGAVGVFASASSSSYFLYNLFQNRELRDLVGAFQLAIGNDREFLPTRVSYKLNLKGPSVNVQTACSSSLVAVHLACQSLLNYQCDMTLAGGVSIRSSLGGYFFMDGGILSPDGHCRTFDARAKGTIFGSGVGAVVLKRLEDALQAGDPIHAVILGSAINNDGSGKVGYTAPGVDGQTRVIAEAQAMAGVDPDSIGSIEAHGTATSLGDPIEVNALSKVFRRKTERNQYCRLGTVKSNVGHLDAAAGITGLLKTVLSIKHNTLVPSLHFETPNPELDLEASPFYVGTDTAEWASNGTPRRGGVSSFGIGGTNAHMILQNAPDIVPSAPCAESQLLVISARTESALEVATERLVGHFQKSPGLNLADVAHTLRVGRAAFEHRRMVVASDMEDAIAALDGPDPRRVLSSFQEPTFRSLAFMFSGQGSQYVGMGEGLYRSREVYRREVDRCCKILEPQLGFDLREVLYSEGGAAEEAEGRLNQTSVTQPALFVTEYALARLWMSLGLEPEVMIGHSIGEYVAACLAGVFSLEDALSVVAERGRLMQEMEPGDMLSVPLSAEDVEPFLEGDLSLAAVNATTLSVVSGPTEEIAALEKKLEAQLIASRRLHTSHAFHSKMMEPMLESFTQSLGRIALNAPKLPFVSNVTGTLITDLQATDPSYWASHVREAVRFADGVGELAQVGDRVFLEVGPGRTLTSLARQHPDKQAGHVFATSLRHPKDERSDTDVLLESWGQLWLAGVKLDAQALSGGERRVRQSLPSYPFEGERYWIEIEKEDPTPARAALSKQADLSDWFYLPSWRRSMKLESLAVEELGDSSACWLVFGSSSGFGDAVVRRLEDRRQDVVRITAGEAFAKLGDSEFEVRPGEKKDLESLVAELQEQDREVGRVLHLWCVDSAQEGTSELERCEVAQALGFKHLMALAQVLGTAKRDEPLHIGVVSSGLHAVLEGDEVEAEKATLLGPCRIVPAEYPSLACTSIDVSLPDSPEGIDAVVDSVLVEIARKPSRDVVAYRGIYRWVQTFEAAPIRSGSGDPERLRKGSVCLVTGGLGGIGLTLAQHLAETAEAKLVLLSRSEFPDKSEWDDWLTSHEAEDGTSTKIQAIRGLEEAGGEVSVFQADTCDADQMAAAVAHARERFGGVNGVVHAAGVPGGGLIQLKSQEMAAAVMAPKVQGTLVLESALEGETLDFFLLCSSMTAVLGGVGQVDYCAANAFLDAFAQSRSQRNGTFAVSVDWDAWGGVGMAVKAAEKYAHPLASVSAAPDTATYEPCEHPLFDRVARNDEAETFVTSMGSGTHWVLDEHRISGQPTLVGTAYLEMARAAFAARGGESNVRVQDVVFLAPLMVPEGETKEVRTVLRKKGEAWEFGIRSQSGTADNGDPTWQEHALGRLTTVEHDEPRTTAVDEVLARCSTEVIDAAARSAESVGEDGTTTHGMMTFGPRWRNLRTIHVGNGEAIAELELPESFADDLGSFGMHPAVLDMATSFAISKLGGGGAYLPFSYGKVTALGPLTRRVYSHVTYEASEASEAKEAIRVDVSILNDQGTEVVAIEGFTMKRLSDKIVEAMSKRQPASKEAASKSRSVPAALKDAILPEEGAEAFRRILAHGGLEQVVVSTLNLHGRIERARSASSENLLEKMEKRAQVSQPTHARPSVRTEFVAPRTELEEGVAAVWQRVLGIEEIGVHDDFIELGGHSLLAIQVISQMREEFNVDLPVDVILNSPTVETLSEAIMQAVAEAADSSELERLLEEVEDLDDAQAISASG